MELVIRVRNSDSELTKPGRSYMYFGIVRAPQNFLSSSFRAERFVEHFLSRFSCNYGLLLIQRLSIISYKILKPIF